MNRKDWTRVVKGWTVPRDPSALYAAPSTEADFDQFEREFGVALPASYRAFASVIGPGRLADFFGISTPSQDRRGANLTASHRTKASKWPKFFGYKNPKDCPEEARQIVRSIWFCSSYNGDQFGWDPEEPTEGKGGEFGIYLMKRTDGERTIKVADTFDEFILDFCLGPKFFKAYPEASRSPKSDSWLFTVPRETYEVDVTGFRPPDPVGVVSDPGLWKTLRSRLEVADVEHPVPKPTEDKIIEFERRTGLVLPRSYREFLAEFGPGQFAHRFHVSSPGYAGLGSLVDLDECRASFDRKQFRKSLIKHPLCANPERIGRIVPFCLVTDRSSDSYIGWDPEDIRSSADHEYGIYAADGGVQFLAPSFTEFVHGVAITDFWVEHYGTVVGVAPTNTFIPASSVVPGRKKKSKKSD